jgi:hypothetical protein
MVCNARKTNKQTCYHVGIIEPYSRSTCVKKKVCWASEIEWPVIKHSMDKKITKGCFERERLRIDDARRV